MQISSFNGGLNKRLSPFLLQSNEGVKYSNIDTTTGALAPLKENKDLNAKIKSSFTYFNNHWVNSDENRDYVKFQDKLFYSNGLTRPQWSNDGFTFYGLGIDKPSLDNLDATYLTDVESLGIEIVWGYTNQGDFKGFDVSVDSFRSYTVDSVEVYGKFSFDAFSESETDVSNKMDVEAFLYAKLYKQGNSWLPILQEKIFKDTISPPYYPTLDFINLDGFYVKSDSSFLPRLTYQHLNQKLVRREPAFSGNRDDYVEYYDWEFTSCISNVVGNTTTYPEIKNPVSLDLGKQIYIVVKDSVNNNSVKSVLSFILPETYTPRIATPADKSDFFVGFSFNWGFSSTDILDIYVEGKYFTTKTESDKDSNSRVTVVNQIIDTDEDKTIDKVAVENGLTGGVQYVITAYNEELGIESSPSDPVNLPTLPGESVIKPVIRFNKINSDLVTHIKLYRIGGSLTQYSLVKIFENSNFTFVDDLADSAIDGAVLNSYNNLPAPDGLEYLTLYNTMLFGSIKDKLYYTDVASPFTWSGFNFIDFDDIITGIGGTSNGLLVFTRHSTYIVTGTSPDTFSKYLLSSGVGCILHKSIQSLQNTLLWLSEDAICASNGGSIQVLSRDKLDILEFQTPRCSAVLNDVYYLSHNSGTLIADFRFGLTFRESDKVYYGLAVKDNSLYGVEADDKFVEINKGTKPLSLTYTSPKFSDGSISTMKIYKDIYFYSSGDLKVKVYIDDDLAGEQTLSKGFTEIKVKSEETRGYSIQFEVTGTGTLNEIEYKVEARQNGR